MIENYEFVAIVGFFMEILFLWNLSLISFDSEKILNYLPFYLILFSLILHSSLTFLDMNIVLLWGFLIFIFFLLHIYLFYIIFYEVFLK